MGKKLNEEISKKIKNVITPRKQENKQPIKIPGLEKKNKRAGKKLRWKKGEKIPDNS